MLWKTSIPNSKSPIGNLSPFGDFHFKLSYVYFPIGNINVNVNVNVNVIVNDNNNVIVNDNVNVNVDAGLHCTRQEGNRDLQKNVELWELSWIGLNAPWSTLNMEGQP